MGGVLYIISVRRIEEFEFGMPEVVRRPRPDIRDSGDIRTTRIGLLASDTHPNWHNFDWLFGTCTIFQSGSFLVYRFPLAFISAWDKSLNHDAVAVLVHEIGIWFSRDSYIFSPACE